MNTLPRLRCMLVIAGSMATALTVTPAVGAGRPQAPSALCVVIENIDDYNFEMSRYSRENGQEIILTTMRAHAADLARSAGWQGPVTVQLRGQAAVPAGARVLRLVWDRGEALWSQDGRTLFLGKTNRTPLAFHPDYPRVSRPIQEAGFSQNARMDALLRAHAEMELYVAIGLAAKQVNVSG